MPSDELLALADYVHSICADNLFVRLEPSVISRVVFGVELREKGVADGARDEAAVPLPNQIKARSFPLLLQLMGHSAESSQRNLIIK